MVRPFLRDRRGVAAVEFGLIAPVLLILLLGTFEIARAVQMHRRFQTVTSMVSELLARETSVTANDIRGMYDVVEHAMKPYETEPLAIQISPVVATGTDGATGRVYGRLEDRPSYNDAPGRPEGSTFPLVPNTTDVNTGLVIVEATYDFEPLFVDDFIGAIRWTTTWIHKPRDSGCVGIGGNPGCTG